MVGEAIAAVISAIALIITFAYYIFKGGAMAGGVTGGSDTCGVTRGGDTRGGDTRGGDTSGGDRFQDAVREKYRTRRKAPPTFEEFCYPKKFAIQPQQKFAAEYMAPGRHRNLLVYHRIGSGKTCLAIQIMRQWTSRGRPLYILPASLIPGLRSELRGPCGGYLTPDEVQAAANATPGSREYRELIQTGDDRIDKDIQIYSYNAFAEHGSRVKAPIVIVDEVQNAVNSHGSFYTSIMSWIDRNPEVVVIIMTATPIFDSPRELSSLARLLRSDVPDDHTLTLDECRRAFAGKVSYFAGAPKYTYPRAYVNVKKCKMSRHQAKWYVSDVEAELKRQGDVRLSPVDNNFYITSRQRSNVVYPKGLTDEAGLAALTPAIIKNSLETYSCKFAALLRKLHKGQLSFVYTSFTEYGGILPLKKCLDVFGWRDYAESGPGPRRYAVWSGDESSSRKTEIRDVFNRSDNDNASKIQIILGSPSIREGVSLMRVRQVHILEAYWNHSRLEQIFGRAVRYCSHKSLPKKDRDVMIYIYAGCANAVGDSKTATPTESIDLYMLNMADEKRDTNQPYLETLVDVAVDKHLSFTSAP